VNLVVATRSVHKMKEIRRILGPLSQINLLSLDDAGVGFSPVEEALEPFDTFEANAHSKARYFYRITGLPTVADDSGLEVDALSGAPGVRSKRFAPGHEHLDGEACDQANNEYLLALLLTRPPEERGARYVCVAALEDGRPQGVLVRGEVAGRIAEAPRGGQGFGYDPLFFDPGLGLTFGEIPDQDKDQRSHRGEAFRRLAEVLRSGGGVR
jgi:XTP/dITP diphosphohydrolase